MLRSLKPWLAGAVVLILTACSGVNTAPTADMDSLAAQVDGSTSMCEALYADAPAGVVVSSSIDYGQPGRLILSFLEDGFEAKAIDWMGNQLGIGVANELGIFENLPMLVLDATVTHALVDELITVFEPLGLVSIWNDEPLEFFLAESVGFIGADAAWDTFSVTGAGVGVAVIDSGIDATHPDLSESVVRNVKIVGSPVDQPLGGYFYVDLPNTDLTSGHGTHVAGTIAGSGAAMDGKYTGVAPGADIIGVGAGEAIAVLYALQGFDFVLKPEVHEQYNVRVISNSWGTTGRFDPYNPISLAIRRAYDEGIITVFAAGNEGPADDTLNPYSASPCAISVAAGDKQGMLADFSSRGIPGDELHHPDITAPGVDIAAARALTGPVTPPDVPDAFYSTISGTSMATPHVSGVIALMLEANPSLTFEDVLDILTTTAVPMLDANGLAHQPHEVGAGYVDAFAAVRAAAESNEDQYEIVSEPLANWQGQVSLSLCPILVACVTQSEHSYELEVPEGLAAMRISVEWLLAAEDLDVYVFDPEGNQVAQAASLSVPEVANIVAPVPGTWTVTVRGYINTITNYTGTADGDFLVDTR